MDPQFVIAGRLRRDYLLPANGSPLIDIPGGNLIHAAAGLGVWSHAQPPAPYEIPDDVQEPELFHWNPDYPAGPGITTESSVGLLARVGEDYPYDWLVSFRERGWDTRGIHVLAEALDLRYFQAILPLAPPPMPHSTSGTASASPRSETGTTHLEPGPHPPRPIQEHRYREIRDDFRESGLSRSNPVIHFARLGLPFPKSLLGYQPPAEPDNLKTAHPASPRPNDIPPDYLKARAVHICPLDYLTTSRLSSTFRQASVSTLTVDPSAAIMTGKMLEDVRILLQGLTAFLPSEEELRALFWGQTDDLWQMAEALGEFGCEFIVVKRGARGQMLYDSVSKKRWEIPAYSARVMDVLGAGDSFCGGFLAGYQKTYDPVRGALYGSVSASLTIEGSGVFHALEALPRLAQARLDALTRIVRQI